MGARPLGRVIQQHIKKPLADEVLFGKLKKGGTVKVTVEQKETGETGLKLEAIADEVPLAPKKEDTKRPSVGKKPGAKKTAAATSKPRSTDKKNAPKKSTVPQLPRRS
jgi:ATP-dependent Clp protease ATP-binding subunit ClpA